MAGGTESEQSGTGAAQHRPSVTDRWPAGLRIPWRIVVDTISACVRFRVTGLAAEAAFWTILSLPPLVFGFAGAIGFVANTFNVDTVATARAHLLALASQALTPKTVDQVIAPTVDEVLATGRFSIVSIGFVIALWSGSRAMNVFVDTISIVYGFGGRRGAVRTRALSFTLYLVFLIAGTILLPLVLAGPGVVDALLPHGLAFLGDLYWPTVLVLSVCILASLYHLSSPVRTPWRADLPGGALALLIWVLGSIGLRYFLNRSTSSTSIYGPLSAPIALLAWLYVVALAILIGAGFNAAIAGQFPQMFSRARQRMRVRRLRIRRLRGRLPPLHTLWTHRSPNRNGPD